MLRLSGVTRTYLAGEVEVPVLRGVDLEIRAGEYVAIMGPSGSGKSTLMNIVGCLDQPSSGQYLLDGREVGRLDDDTLSQVRGATIGFVFQSFHLLKSLTVCDNVALPAEYQGVSRADRQARAKRLLERVGLGHRLHHRPTQLSGGERQRVAIARALINTPRLLLADEPTGNLDTHARDDILGLFRELKRETGLTVITVTHDPFIGDAADRCIHVLDGRVVDASVGGGLVDGGSVGVGSVGGGSS